MPVGLNGVFGTMTGIPSPALAGWVIDVSGSQHKYALSLGGWNRDCRRVFMLIAHIRPIEKNQRALAQVLTKGLRVDRGDMTIRKRMR